MSDVKKSRRGVYYDLTKSPYEYKTPYGDIFKFSSAKKLEIFSRDIDKEIKRIDDVFNRHGLLSCLPDEIITLVKRCKYLCFYDFVER